MTEGSGRKTDQQPDDVARDAVRQSRRRMLRAGLVAAPMIVTLRGRPALAQAASLGSLGIFYGQYTQFNGEWVPADPDGNPLFIPGTETVDPNTGEITGDIDTDRRGGATNP